jgi:hypothetical protein
MAMTDNDHALTRRLGRPWPFLLSLLAGIACSSTGGGTPGAGGSATGGGVAGGGGIAATGGRGGGSGGSQPGGAGGGLAGGAGTGNAAGVAGATGGSAAAGSGGAGGRGGAGGSTGAGGSAGGASGSTGGGARGGAGGAAGAGGAGNTAGAGGTAGAAGADTVTRTASTFRFTHFPIQTSSGGVWNGPSTAGTTATSTTYDTVVLENGYLRVTLLPKYGGRILSIVYKPTNQELLYQNPIGTPYLMGQGIFYYDYLVIMGGIFPSFPEPEHGKYWNQPYDLLVVSESKDAITVRMSRKDDLPLATGVPSKYDVGRTDVLVDVEVTLRAGSTRVELATKLTNTKNTPVSKLEYWTVTTLAPGSTPGSTAIPLNTRILAAMDKVHLLESSWSWFGTAEERVSGEIFKWKNLASFKNWVDQGTAFANPDYRANWSGLMNDDKARGIVRVADNTKSPGLKLWTFGPQGLSIDINNSATWVRPTIEMWHGITPEFWMRATLAANEVRQWSQSFFPILGLKDVTAASENGALYLSSAKSGSNTMLGVAATLTLPDQTVKATLRLNGAVVSEQDVVVAATQATTVNATVPSSMAPAGAVFAVDLQQGGRSLLAGQITLP